jgi:hypothetical protein
VNYYLLRRILPVSWGSLGKAVFPSLASSVIAALVFFLAATLVGDRLWLQLLTGFSLATTMYIGLLNWFDQPSVKLVTHELSHSWHSLHKARHR